MISFCTTLLPNDKIHATPADIGKKIKPIPVIDNAFEADVAPIVTIVSTDSDIVFRVSYFYFSFLVYGFCLLNV